MINMVKINLTPKTPYTPRINPIVLSLQNAEIELNPGDEVILEVGEMNKELKIRYYINVIVWEDEVSYYTILRAYVKNAGAKYCSTIAEKERVRRYKLWQMPEKERFENQINFSEEEIGEFEKRVNNAIKMLGLAYFVQTHYAGQ